MKWWFGIDLWKRVIAGLVLGALVGLGLRYGLGPEAASANVSAWAKPIGDAFINLIKMLVVPLIFTTLLSGVLAMGDPSRPSANAEICRTSTSESLSAANSGSIPAWSPTRPIASAARRRSCGSGSLRSATRSGFSGGDASGVSTGLGDGVASSSLRTRWFSSRRIHSTFSSKVAGAGGSNEDGFAHAKASRATSIDRRITNGPVRVQRGVMTSVSGGRTAGMIARDSR